MKKEKLVQLFRILISVLFVFSAISKIISLPFFDSLVAKLLLGKDYYDQPTGYLFVQWFTRLLIAAEMLLGVAILQTKYLKKLVLPTIFGLLLLFTIHLFYEGFTDKFIGGNCGCFGDLVPLDNFESIIKNLVAMFLVGFIWKYYKRKNEMRFRSWVFSLVVGSVTLLTLLLTVKGVGPKVEIKDYQNESEELVDSVVPDTTDETLDTLTVVQKVDSVQKEKIEDPAPVNSKEEVTKPKEIKQLPKVEPKAIKRTVFTDYSNFTGSKSPVVIDQGERMVCMFSLTCGHCQEAYKNICTMADQGGFPPIYLFLYGDSQDQLNYFFNQAGCKHPYIFIQDYLAFERLLEGTDFPRILHRKDGKNLKEWGLDTYSKESLAEYFGLEVPQEEGNGLGF